ncbi:MAG: hypothetical protein H7A45_07285 [Verrucomicrobiales bacterium]|nr:hypothetical protein [Verrucomicrobiales bacterium]
MPLILFLRSKVRRKDGKAHRTWSIVENHRVRGGKVVQRHVLYLGEINSSQREAWRKSIKIFEDDRPRPRTAALFPEPYRFSQWTADGHGCHGWGAALPPWQRSRETSLNGEPEPRARDSGFPQYQCPSEPIRGESNCMVTAEQDAREIRDDSIISIPLKDLALHRPRQWGACWLVCEPYEQASVRRPDSWMGNRKSNSRTTARGLLASLCKPLDHSGDSHEKERPLAVVSESDLEVLATEPSRFAEVCSTNWSPASKRTSSSPSWPAVGT